MRIRVLRSVAVGVLVIASLGSPAAAQSTPRPEPPPDLTDAERRALAGMVLRALEATYAGDPAPLAAIATPDAIIALEATDRRAAAVAAGDRRYLGGLSTGAILEMEPFRGTTGVTREVLELRIEAAPGARFVDEADRVIEVSTGAAWWTLAVTFERDDVDADWRITGFGPATELELAFTPLPDAPPCPWDPATRRRATGDPFLLSPWCDADGHGRLVPGPDDLPAGQYGVISLVSGADCGWTGLRLLTVGWPVGSPIDDWSFLQYQRDPRDEVAGPGFRADVELPDDAVSSGITNGRATIWTSDGVGRRAVFVEVDGRVERWPRATGGCA